MDTDAFIDRLAEGLVPVRRLRSPSIRAITWLAVGIPPLVFIALLDGFVIDPKALARDGQLVVELLALLATATTAAAAASASTIPAISRKWLLLPIVPAAIWLASIVEEGSTDWMRLGLESLGLRFDGTCVLPMVLMGITPTMAMVIMLHRGASLLPTVTTLFGALAVAAVASFGLRLIRVPDLSLMPLLLSFGIAACHDGAMREPPATALMRR